MRLCLVIISIVLFALFVFGINSKEKTSPLAFTILASSVFISNEASNILFVILVMIMLFRDIKILEAWNTPPMNLYCVFLIFCIVTLCYSSSWHYGILMIIKLSLPLIFWCAAYSIIDNDEDIICVYDFIVKFIPFIVVFSCPPFSRLGSVLPVLHSWSSGYTVQFIFFSVIALSLFLINSNRKYLFIALFCIFPPLLLLRRTVLGCAFLIISIFLVFQKKFKAIVPIFIIASMSLLAILNVPILKDRFFGGDKGDISQFTNKELISSVDYLSSSGRYAMWDYMIDKFYVGNEMFGCGLGSMKEFMRANEDSGDTEHFAMLHNDLLHILIETGIVGIILFFLFWVRVVRDSVRDMFDASNPYFLRVFAFAALAVSIAILFSMIFENILSSLFTYGITFVFIGVYYKYKSLAGR